MAIDTMVVLFGGLYILMLLMGGLNMLHSMKIQKMVQDMGEIQSNMERSSESVQTLSKRFEGIKALLKEEK